MARPFSLDLRERVVDAVERGGLSCRQAAARFGVGVSTAIAWVARFRQTGSVAPGPMGGHRPKKLVGPWRELVDRVQETTEPERGRPGGAASGRSPATPAPPKRRDAER